MRWRGERESTNVEDRRGMSFGRPAAIGGGSIVVVLLAMLLGVDPRAILTGLQGTGSDVQVNVPTSQPTDEMGKFVSTVFADLEDTWTGIFKEHGETFHSPTLVLFTDATPTECGYGESAMGPFYCPIDEKVYIDLGFYQELDQRFGAPGDFAEAYVLAHEVGHHVQKLLGIMDRIQRMSAGLGEEDTRALSVRQELQADCLAGVWGAYAARRGILEPGDVEEGLRAAAAIGDDVIQRQTTGRVVPETWTHGSSAQRLKWLKRGLDSGNMDDCDTFEDNP